jgi:hypothetical protein
MTRLTRAAVAAVTLCLPTAALTLGPSPAEAAVITATNHSATVGFSKNPSGTTCTIVIAGGVDSGPFAADGVPVVHSKTAAVSINNDNVATDKTAASGSSSNTVVATQADGQLSHVSMTANATTSLTTASATPKCGGRTTLSSATTFTFDLVRPTLVSVTVESHNVLGELAVGKLSGGIPLAAIQYAVGPHHSGTDSVLLPAGTGYSAVADVGMELTALTTAGTTTLNGDIKVDFSFEEPGVPTTAAQGTGKKYVALGDRDCTTGAVSATWSRKAGKGKVRTVPKATFYVDGQKAIGVKKPKKGRVTKVPADPTRAVQVQGFIKVKGKGQLLVQRSYRPCS